MQPARLLQSLIVAGVILLAAGCDPLAFLIGGRKPSAAPSAAPGAGAGTGGTIRTPEAPSLAWSQANYQSLEGTLSLKAPDGLEAGAYPPSLALAVRSEAEPGGEEIILSRTADGSDLYRGSVPFERVFGPAGDRVSEAGNGRLAVYAEGGRQSDHLVAEYRGSSSTLRAEAEFEEPASTVTGVIQAGGRPAGGALVVLSSPASTETRATVSRSDGSYAFHDVKSGSYLITARRNGAGQLSRTVAVP